MVRTTIANLCASVLFVGFAASLTACGSGDIDPRTLSRTTELPPNANCNAGEIRTQTGIDVNQNSVLEDAEVVTDVYSCVVNNGLGGDDRLFNDV